MRQRNLLVTLIGGAFLVCLGATPAAVAAGGDFAWANPEATTVTYKKGKVFSSGLFFLGEFGQDVELSVRATAAHDGEILWDYRLTGYSDPDKFLEPTQIAVKGRKVVVVGYVDADESEVLDSDWLVIGLDARTGEPLWPEVIIAQPGSGGANSVALVGKYIVATGYQCEDQVFNSACSFVTRGFSLATGEPLWEHIDERHGRSFGDKIVGVVGDDDDDCDSDSEDGFHGDDDDDSSVAVAYGIIDSLSVDPANPFDQLIRAFDPKTGYVVWDETYDSGFGDAGGDSLVADKGVAYFAFQSFNGTWQLFARDARTGAPLWTNFNESGWVNGIAVRGRHLVVVGSGGVQAFNAKNGQFRWDYVPVENSIPDRGPVDLITPVITKGFVVISGVDLGMGFVTNVTALKLRNGELAWSNSDVFAFHPAFVQFNVGDSIAAGKGLVFIGALVQTYALEVR